MSKRQINVIQSIVVILTFLLAYNGKDLLSSYVMPFYSNWARVLYFYCWWLIPSVCAVGILFGYRDILNSLGLNKGISRGFLFALIAVLPMLVSSAIAGEIHDPLRFDALMQGSLFAGFMEEFLFRGFLFGILYRKLGWGFIPAALLGAVIFGMGHLYQGSSSMEAMGVFFVTGMGALWFAWLYIEWDNNLWIPVFLHIFMNLSWLLFDVGGNALGDSFSNIFRITTIAITVVATIVYRRKQGGFCVNRKSLIQNVIKI